MTHSEIRDKFLKFFESRGHKIVPSSSLLPSDPSVLFTTAGMQQFKPYYTGVADAMRDFGSLNTTSIQKCIRTSDIDEVGDERHLTFFEMLGNFSFGGPDASKKVGASYFKEDAIKYAHEFITKEMGLKIDYVSVFGGEDNIPADEEAEQIWKTLDPNITVKRFGRADNFWGPTGDEGPCGPTTEIYVNPSTDGLGQAIEIWNIVFNQYYCRPPSHKASEGQARLEKLASSGIDPVRGRHAEGSASVTLGRLSSNGIDTGMGLERLVMVSQQVPTVFETDLFKPILVLTPSELDMRIRRIIADHSRAIAFLIADGVRPSNKEQGYVLRRLMRRIITYNFINKTDISLMHPVRSKTPAGSSADHAFEAGRTSNGMHDIFAKIGEIYGQYYPELNTNAVIHEFEREEEKFRQTLKHGLRELEKTVAIDAGAAFKLYESYGLPYEIIKELGQEKTAQLSRGDFDAEFKKHQEISRAGAEKKFGGHGLILNTGELKAGNEEELKKATRLHTATHLLHASLRKILGDEVRQTGSDITPERLRFDFNFPRKLTPEEILQVERLVNDVIKDDMKVTKITLPLEEAIKTGALHFFKAKYPNRVDIYTIGPELAEGQPFSQEFCGGPHVQHTGEIGKFKIIKEEAVSAGVRRIRATIFTD